jgi:hypothetical protein
MRRFAPILPMALALVACSGDADPVPLVAPLGPVPSSTSTRIRRDRGRASSPPGAVGVLSRQARRRVGLPRRQRRGPGRPRPGPDAARQGRRPRHRQLPQRPAGRDDRALARPPGPRRARRQQRLADGGPARRDLHLRVHADGRGHVLVPPAPQRRRADRARPVRADRRARRRRTIPVDTDRMLVLDDVKVESTGQLSRRSPAST